MILNIEDPTEGDTHRGYWSIRVSDERGVIAEFQLAEDVVDDVLEVNDAAELYRTFADLIDAIEEVTDGE